MGIEDRAVVIEGAHSLDVPFRPGARPYLGPSARRGQGVYFATSIARDSRMTMTFT